MYETGWENPDERVRSVAQENPRYRSPRKRARNAVWMLGLVIVANVVVAVLDAISVSLLTSALDGGDDALDKIELRDTLSVVGAILAVLAGIAAAIAFMLWMTRAYANVDGLAPGARRYGRNWAWGGWLVPIMHFFRPKQVINDIWFASAGRGLPAWLQGWWVLWLATSIAGTALGRVQPETLEQFRWLDAVDGVVSLAIVVGALLAIRLVRTLTALQEEHAQRPPPPPERPPERQEGFTIEPGWAPSEGR